MALLAVTSGALAHQTPDAAANPKPPEKVAAISGNPAATDFGITGTGWLGRQLGLKDEWGVKLGGVWLADTNVLVAGGAQPGGWTNNQALIVGLNVDAEKLVDWRGAWFGVQFLQFNDGETNEQAGSIAAGGAGDDAATDRAVLTCTNDHCDHLDGPWRAKNGGTMKRRLLQAAAGIVAAGLAAGTASAQAPATLPDYLANISGNTASSPSDVATRDLLQLDIGMFTLYDRASNIYRRNILAKHPIILAMFTNQGGNLMLFRPGQAPITAPQVPKVYQILKSTGHSTMAISQVVIPSVNNPADKRWIAPMAAYRTQMKTALDGLDASNDIQADWKPAVKEILANNLAYMDDCLAKGVVTLEPLLAFARKQAPNIKLIINWAASTQVKHWMGVMDQWSAMLGPDMAKTYAASNTIYVARQNNVLFSVLAQYFGADALNDRLMLIETMGFTTTAEEMLVAMTRIIGDRSVGELFFGNYKIMDFELMGGDGRKTIIAEMQRRGKQPTLPPAVPFGSKQWPTLITPGPGPTSLDDLK